MESKFLILILTILISLIQNAFSECSYRTDSTYGYMCDFTIQNPSGRNNFTDISGRHSWFRGDGSVERVAALSGSYSINIPAIICSKFYNNVWLDLRSIGIQSIDSTSVKNCKKLQYLDFNNNKITDVNKSSFVNNLELRTLLLYYNQISTLPDGVFGSLKKLTTLSLNHNKLSELPSNIFGTTTALKELNLENNEIQTLPSNIFGQLINLQNLLLSNNKISQVSPDWFYSLKNLLTLYLDGNQIQELPENAFSSLKKVTKIFLKNNNLTIIHSNAFGTLPALTHIYLRNNKIDGFYEKIIDSTVVNTLDMYGNLCANSVIYDNSTKKELMRTAMGKCFDNYELTVFGCISGNLDARVCTLEGENEKALATFQKIDNKTQNIASAVSQLSNEIKVLKQENQSLRSELQKIENALSNNITCISSQNQEFHDNLTAQMEVYAAESADRYALIIENQSEIKKAHALIDEWQVFVGNQSIGYEDLQNKVIELMSRPCGCP